MRWRRRSSPEAPDWGLSLRRAEEYLALTAVGAKAEAGAAMRAANERHWILIFELSRERNQEWVDCFGIFEMKMMAVFSWPH